MVEQKPEDQNTGVIQAKLQAISLQSTGIIKPGIVDMIRSRFESSQEPAGPPTQQKKAGQGVLEGGFLDHRVSDTELPAPGPLDHTIRSQTSGYQEPHESRMQSSGSTVPNSTQDSLTSDQPTNGGITSSEPDIRLRSPTSGYLEHGESSTRASDSPTHGGSRLHAHEIRSPTSGYLNHHESTMNPSDTSPEAVASVVRSTQESQTSGQQISDPRTSTYLFTDRTTTPHSFSAVPELEPLTRPVPQKDQISITIGPFVIIICDLVIPVIVYYTWLRNHPEDPKFEDKILGYAVIPFGLGEIYILVVRVWRLIKFPDKCAPLLSKHTWELDATSWVYGTALLAGLIPFVISTNIDGVPLRTIPQLYLYSPGIYMTYLWVWMLITLIPFKLPIRVNSEPKGSRIRPLAYYAAEDFFSVDGWQGREFRQRYKERYEMSPMFQKMILECTLHWFAGIMLYLGTLSAVIWNTPFDVAFGLCLGLLFGWIITWAVLTYIFVQLALAREKAWWSGQKSTSKAQ